MTPDPLPFDRDEFVFKERKHERGQSFDAVTTSGGGGNPTHRWRDPYYPSRRPPPSYHRQGVSYHQLNEESPSRPVGGERFWRHGGRGSRGPFRRYDSVPHVTSQRSVAVPVHSPPPLKSDSSPPPLKSDSSPTTLKSDRDHVNSLGSARWKPLKWAQESLEDVGTEAPPPPPSSGKETPVVESAVRVEDELPKKKARLGWGQGLAKYEKQKVEGSANSGKDQVSETSPKIVGMAGSLSPPTPSSALCISSQAGTEYMPFSKAENVENDTFHSSDSPAIGSKSYTEELSINTDNWPPISMLTSLLSDLSQYEDAFSGDSTFTRNTAMNKLLLFKADIAKELETAECEIDLFENELKSLNANGESVPYQTSLMLQDEMAPISCAGSAEGSMKTLLGFSSAMTETEEPALRTCSSNEHDTYAKNADDSIPQLLISSVGQSGSVDNEMFGIVTVNSVGHAYKFEKIPESQHLPLDDEGRVTNENVTIDEQKLDSSSSSSTIYTVAMSSHGIASDDLITVIMASNRDAAKRASHVFGKALPILPQDFDMWGSDRILSCRKNDMHVNEKLALHKCQLKFKERVLTLKFRALHHLWKEDLRLLSVRKQRPKSHKRFELHSRSSQSAQKNRSSIRSRSSFPAVNLMLVPTKEIIDFTSKLSDSHIKMFRSNLKLPALILDEKERRFSRFITKNSLVEDPQAFEKERTMINPWTQEERRVFTEMLAAYGKDFAKISSFLSHKNTADCIEFYYKNHKSESFRDAKKQLDSRKQWRGLPTNTYMVTTGKKWNRESNAPSLDMLGAVSMTAANENGHTRKQQKFAGKAVRPSYHNPRASYGPLEMVNSIKSFGFDNDTAAPDGFAGMCGTLSSEAVNSCVTSLEKMNFVMTEQPLTPDVVTQFVEEDDTCSDEGCGELSDSVDWTDEEKSTFISALSLYGKDFSKISHCVGTKSRDKCKIFFSKARKCLGLDMIQPAAGNVEPPVSYVNGGRSETDDACAELDSAICSTQSCSKMDVDFTHEGVVHAGNTLLKTQKDQSSEQYELRESSKEDLGGKADGLESTFNIDKLDTEGNNLQSPKSLGGMADNTTRCNVMESTGDRESSKLKNGMESTFNIDKLMGGKADGLESTFNIDKLDTEGNNLQSPKSLEGMADNTTRCNIMESTGDRESSELKNDRVSFRVEQIVTYTKEKQLSPSTNCEQLEPQMKASTTGKCLSDAGKSEVGLQQQVRFVPESTSGDVQQEKIGMAQCNSVNLLFSADLDANTARNVPYATKSPVTSMKQDTIHSISVPSSIYSEGFLGVTSPSTLNFEGHPNKRQQVSATRDFSQQSMLGNQSVKQIDHVLNGYPVQVSSQSDRYFVQEINSKKSSSVVPNSRSVMFPSASDDLSLRSSPQKDCQESAEQSTPFKLFGQIVSNPSPLHKSNSLPLDCDGQVCWPELKTSTKDNDSIFPSRPQSSGQAGHEEVPKRSYSFWDGNMIQTGFSSLPESALMDYQQAYVQPLSADGKRHPELKKRNGIEIVSGIQQQRRTAMARLDVNMVGGAGVSDPVAAILAATGRPAVEQPRSDLGGR